MTGWVVRAGRYGEDEQLALDQDLVCIRWIIPNNLSRTTDKKQLYIYEDLRRKPRTLVLG